MSGFMGRHWNEEKIQVTWKPVELRKGRRAEDAPGSLSDCNLHHFSREHREAGRPVVNSTGRAPGERADPCGVEN